MTTGDKIEDLFSMSNSTRSGLTPFVRRRLVKKTESIIQRLIDYQVLKGKNAQITEMEISNICLLVNDVFLDAPVCLEIKLNRPLYILGDIYGQYGDLLRIFNVLGHPPASRYLFLGNYVDRGNQSIETICLLFAYKIRYPGSIFLLRGNHECKRVSRHFGFYEECFRRYNSRLWKAIVATFEYMPVAAIIEESIFCTHSGLSPGVQYSTLKNQSDLKEFMSKMIQRPTDVDSNTLVTHFLWSDADPEIRLWDQNPAGLGYLYGSEVVADFCDRFGFQQVIRSNEMVDHGYEFFVDNRLLTIFSAPNYCGKFRNSGSVVFLKKSAKDKELKARVYVVKPIMRLRNKMTGRMNIVIERSDAIDKVDNSEETM